MIKTLLTAIKVVFIIPIVLILSIFILFYIYNKVIKIPLISNVIYKDAPWKSYDGKTCSWGNCYTSEMNQKYQYWSELAIQKRDAELCNNVEGQDAGDYGVSKEEAINHCKETYGLKVGEAQYCNLHNGERRIACIINIDKKFPDRNILTQEKCTEYISSKIEYTNCMTALASKKNDANFCYLLRQANYPSGETKCLSSIVKNEKRTDNLRINASVTNIKTSMQVCNNYHAEANRYECYFDVVKGIQNNDGYVPNTGYTILDQNCLEPV